MPAKSQAQQRFFGLMDAIKNGNLSPKSSPKATKVAKTMRLSDIRDFARTKLKGLPKRARRGER